MLHDLDDSLEQLIGSALSDVNPIAISFAPPDESFPPEGVSLPAINLFLYEVRENRELSSGSPQRVARDAGSLPIQLRDPVWINSSYLITAWTSGGPRAYRDEHYLLGRVLATILKHPLLPQGVLRGELGHCALPIRMLPVPSDRTQGMGEFWQAMGGKPKASLGLTVTFPMQLDASRDARTPVRERIIHVATRSKDRPGGA